LGSFPDLGRPGEATEVRNHYEGPNGVKVELARNVDVLRV
jgi:hypothetical protein